jgi:predicted MPP superfamily phosphohydrolase
MNVNSIARWRRDLLHLEMSMHLLPFYLVGGPVRVARWMANQLVVNKIQLSFPHLPRAFDGLTITHLSDFHLGPLFTVENHLPPLVAACRELNSDLICCTGDWVDFELDHLPEAVKELDQLRPRLGWYGVLGNHDYLSNRWRLVKILRPWLKNRLLNNDFVRLQLDGENLDVCGLDFSVGGPRLERGLKALATRRGAPTAFTLGLAHIPDFFDRFREAQQVDLMLSGHTHGGQISWTPPPEPAIGPVTSRYPYCRGLYEVKGSYLYVSCGLGATVPLRINCPPEVIQFTLVRGEQNHPGNLLKN